MLLSRLLLLLVQRALALTRGIGQHIPHRWVAVAVACARSRTPPLIRPMLMLATVIRSRGRPSGGKVLGHNPCQHLRHRSQAELMLSHSVPVLSP